MLPASHLVMDLVMVSHLVTVLALVSHLVTVLALVSHLVMVLASDLKMELGLVSDPVMDLWLAAALKMEPGLVSDPVMDLWLASAAAVTLPAVRSSAVLELSAAQSLMAWTHYCQVKVKFPQLPHLPYTSYNSMQSFPLHKLPSEPLKMQAFQFSQLILELLLPLKAQYQTVQNHQAPSFLQEALNTELTYCS